MSALLEFIHSLHRGFLADDPDAAAKELEARNVALAQSMYRAIERGDFPALLGVLDEDVRFEIVGPPTVPLVGRWFGREAVVEAVRKNFSHLDNQHPEMLSVVAQGDTVVISARERGRFRQTGREYDIHWTIFLTFRDGKLVRGYETFDSGPFLEAMRPA
jgi:ketosteroid isomerase-like protein